MTSPSTRRRSIESTISLIREAVDGKGEEANDAAVDQMVEQFAGGSGGRKGSRGSSPARSAREIRFLDPGTTPSGMDLINRGCLSRGDISTSKFTAKNTRRKWQ
ncbi:hypothetical protein FRC07_001857 [Ceratobasidium sp. 392]|nr:hypothetical protein FRC07_001857 [Ceratobasidium sp. 392]